MESGRPTPLRPGTPAVERIQTIANPVPFGWRADTYLFFALFVSIFVAIANGSIFCFALISPALSAPPFSFTTREVNLVSTVGVITSYFSLPTGQLYDRTSPRVTLLVGAAINIVGWFTLFLIFDGVLPISVGLMTVVYSITQAAATYFETGSVLPNMDAFALHEGRIVMIQKTFMGLGTSVIAAIFNAFFISIDLKWFFIFLTLFSGLAGCCGAFFVKRPQHYPELNVSGLNVGDELSPQARKYDKPFFVGIAVLWANIIFIFIMNIVQSQITLSWSAQFAVGLVTIVLVIGFFGMLGPLPSRVPQLSEEDAAEIFVAEEERQSLLAGGEPRSAVISRLHSAASFGGTPGAPTSPGPGYGSPDMPGSKAAVEYPADSHSARQRNAAAIAAASMPPSSSTVAGSGGGGATTAPDTVAAGSTAVSFQIPDRANAQDGGHLRRRSDVESRGSAAGGSGVWPRSTSVSRLLYSTGIMSHSDFRDSRASITTNPRSQIRNVFSLAGNIARPELWLMWYVSFATWGGMTLVNTNTMQIYKAIAGPSNFDDARNTVFVSLFGLGSALGRVFVGGIKPKLEEHDIPVWWTYIMAPVLMVIALILLLTVPAAGLFLPFFAVGFAGGTAWGSTVLIIKRVFTEAGRHYSFLYTAGMLTPLFFNLWLFSSTYEDESRRQHQKNTSDCDGIGCIAMPVGVALGMNVLALPLSIIFARRIDTGHIFE